MNTKNLLFSIAVLLLFSQCHFNSTQVDDPKDIEEAVKVSDEFLQLAYQNKWQNIYAGLGTKLKSDSAKIKEIVGGLYAKYGKLKEKTYVTTQSLVMTGSDPRAEYHIVYKNYYENGFIIEDFYLEKENGKIVVNGYHTTLDKL
jgi:hypothetical protein